MVLAGVNGAGKSSIGGAFIEANGGRYFNPDVYARRAMVADTALDQTTANALAWNEGHRQLASAIADGRSYAFETTLGGNSIAETLLVGARNGAEIHVWFAGLSSPELHMARVASRVTAGGHDIPENRIRARFESSRSNLIRLLPVLASLHLYDNSAEHDPKAGGRPIPVLLLKMAGGKPLSHAPLAKIPDWAKPILMAALSLR